MSDYYTSWDSINIDEVDKQYEEEMLKYLQEKYPLIADFEQYNYTYEGAVTIDKYLMLLIKGYVNASARSEINKHIMETIEDEWFHQWPLVRWQYASGLLRGYNGTIDIEKAINILLPLAEEGCPNALYDIGCCYMEGCGFETCQARH